MKEIERKFLVDKKRLPEVLSKLNEEVSDSGVYRIEQYYLNDDVDHWTIRIRSELFIEMNHDRVSDVPRCELTLKSKGHLSREELTTSLTKDEFEHFVLQAKTKVLKTRHRLVYRDELPVFEIDIYDDFDFVTCEVEFLTVEDSKKFCPPSWCIKDVTEFKKYKNVYLAKPIH